MRGDVQRFGGLRRTSELSTKAFVPLGRAGKHSIYFRTFVFLHSSSSHSDSWTLAFWLAAYNQDVAGARGLGLLVRRYHRPCQWSPFGWAGLEQRNAWQNKRRAGIVRAPHLPRRRPPAPGRLRGGAGAPRSRPARPSSPPNKGSGRRGGALRRTQGCVVGIRLGRCRCAGPGGERGAGKGGSLSWWGVGCGGSSGQPGSHGGRAWAPEEPRWRTLSRGDEGV